MCDFLSWKTGIGFNKISDMNAVGFAFWNKVIRAFIRAVRLLEDSLARGENGGFLHGVSQIFLNPFNFIG